MKIQLRGLSRPPYLIIFLIGMLVIVCLAIVLWFSFSKTNSNSALDASEEAAIRFVENAYVHPNPEAVKPLVGENMNPSIYTNTYIRPGKIKIGSHEGSFGYKYVDIFLPRNLCDIGSRIEIELKMMGNKWVVTDDSAIKGETVSSFEEFQQTEYWDRKGKRWKWKDAELR